MCRQYCASLGPTSCCYGDEPKPNSRGLHKTFKDVHKQGSASSEGTCLAILGTLFCCICTICVSHLIGILPKLVAKHVCRKVLMVCFIGLEHHHSLCKLHCLVLTRSQSGNLQIATKHTQSACLLLGAWS